MQTTTPNKLLLNSRETAKLLGISERSLWTITNEGELPVVRIGRSVRYKISDVEAYVDRHRVTKGGDA